MGCRFKASELYAYIISQICGGIAVAWVFYLIASGNPAFSLSGGLALTLIHLVSIPVTNTSVNPARSTGPAVFVGG